MKKKQYLWNQQTFEVYPAAKLRNVLLLFTVQNQFEPHNTMFIRIIFAVFEIKSKLGSVFMWSRFKYTLCLVVFSSKHKQIQIEFHGRRHLENILFYFCCCCYWKKWNWIYLPFISYSLSTKNSPFQFMCIYFRWKEHFFAIFIQFDISLNKLLLHFNSFFGNGFPVELKINCV